MKHIPMRVLMCAPPFFDVTEKDKHGNLHMDPNNRPDKKWAHAQWENLVALYQNLGVEVIFIDPVPELPDMTFAANCGLTFMKNGKPCFIPSNFRPERRRGERPHYINFFTRLGYEIIELPEQVFFEGAGDALTLADDTLLVGHGFRTSREARAYLSALTGKKVVSLELQRPKGKDKILYHTDTAMAVFPGTHPAVVVCPDALTPDSYDILFYEIAYRRGMVLTASYKDAINLALNAVVIPIDKVTPIRRAHFPEKSKGVVITVNTASKELLNTYESLGYIPLTVPLSEFVKSGGGAFCLSKILPC